MTDRRKPESLSGKRVTVVGLGRFGGGVGVTRWLCSVGADVTVSDQADESRLAESIKQLGDCGARLHFGGHLQEDILNAELLVINPAIPMNHPLLSKAATIPRTTEINLFLERCAAPIIGITGSAGKSTTTAMTGEILSKKFTTHVGGNIGHSLLDSLDDIAPDHVVVLELSSFQIENLPLSGISPQVALVTNIAENHLDRHITMESYIDAKKNIFRFQGGQDVLILNQSDPVLAEWAEETPGKVDYFSTPADGSLQEEDCFVLSIPGDHNQANAQAAWTAASQFGIDREMAASALRVFTGLTYRLQEVCRRDGVVYVNDSKSTAPAESIVALDALEADSVVILLGGHDKGVSYDELAKVVCRQARAVVTFGAAGETILDAIESCPGRVQLIVKTADNMTDAVQIALDLAIEGDTVVLSPGCASFDEFENYRGRGDKFTELVKGAPE